MPPHIADMRTLFQSTISHLLGQQALPVLWILPRTGPKVCLVPLPYLCVLTSLETLGFSAASLDVVKASVDLILPESVWHILFLSPFIFSRLSREILHWMITCALKLVMAMRRARYGAIYMRRLSKSDSIRQHLVPSCPTKILTA